MFPVDREYGLSLGFRQRTVDAPYAQTIDAAGNGVLPNGITMEMVNELAWALLKIVELFTNALQFFFNCFCFLLRMCTHSTNYESGLTSTE